MSTIISGDTGIDKITDGSVVADDLASTLDLSSKTITLATDAAVVSKLSTASGSAPSYSARAWVNFNGTGTVAIRESGNVSSITDQGVGIYAVNFTTAMPDANYSTIAITDSETGDSNRPVLCIVEDSNSNSSLCQIRAVGTYNNNTRVDVAVVNVSIFR